MANIRQEFINNLRSHDYDYYAKEYAEKGVDGITKDPTRYKVPMFIGRDGNVLSAVSTRQGSRDLPDGHKEFPERSKRYMSIENTLDEVRGKRKLLQDALEAVSNSNSALHGNGEDFTAHRLDEKSPISPVTYNAKSNNNRFQNVLSAGDIPKACNSLNNSIKKIEAQYPQLATLNGGRLNTKDPNAKSTMGSDLSKYENYRKLYKVWSTQYYYIVDLVEDLGLTLQNEGIASNLVEEKTENGKTKYRNLITPEAMLDLSGEALSCLEYKEANIIDAAAAKKIERGYVPISLPTNPKDGPGPWYPGRETEVPTIKDVSPLQKDGSVSKNNRAFVISYDMENNEDLQAHPIYDIPDVQADPEDDGLAASAVSAPAPPAPTLDGADAKDPEAERRAELLKDIDLSSLASLGDPEESLDDDGLEL